MSITVHFFFTLLFRLINCLSAIRSNLQISRAAVVVAIYFYFLHVGVYTLQNGYGENVVR